MAKKDNIVPINAPKAEPKSIKILSENAQLKHINQRHEGSGEEPILALTHATKKTCQLSIISKVGVLMNDDKNDPDLLEDQEDNTEH